MRQGTHKHPRRFNGAKSRWPLLLPILVRACVHARRRATAARPQEEDYAAAKIMDAVLSDQARPRAGRASGLSGKANARPRALRRPCS